jgi:hypothetical protein
MEGLLMANRFVQARSYGGAFRSGQPRLIVIHSLEAPPRRGLAYDLAAGWLQNAGVSPQHMTDPGETVDTLRPGIVGYHCGNGNQQSVGLEVTGYAGWSKDQWLDPTAFAAVRLDAKQGAAVAKHYGIPMRWLSLAQIRNGERGFCTHNDISLTLGGTNHWDPGPNFPYGIFMQMVQQFAGGWDGIKDDPKPVTPDAPGPGGADPEEFTVGQFEDIMARLDVIEKKTESKAQAQDIANRVADTLSDGGAKSQAFFYGPAMENTKNDIANRVADKLSPKE